MSSSFSRMYPKQLKTSNVCALVKKETACSESHSTIKTAYSIGLYQGLWYREGISPTRTEQVGRRFMEGALMMKVSITSMIVRGCFQWPIQAQTQIIASSSLLSNQLHGWTVITCALGRSLKEWMWLSRSLVWDPRQERHCQELP